MNRFAGGGILLLLSAAGVSAFARVHRCGDGKTYTDKPCDGAEAVDLRSNILDAGPRFIPRQDAPAPALIAPDTTRQRSAADGGSAWDRKQQRDSEHQNRTYRR
ncbi:hypothetical protein HK414_07435 [Ramlibacter terrae]|uniref:DUF4124 domain-containing protein n=1 Tax=Ramlibacter terrae TaxID=2732511 RepID=A0ABX6P2Q4_9BURK|nr:hypothetical protein HK414_07435 [Ramlibacter terrae]